MQNESEPGAGTLVFRGRIEEEDAVALRRYKLLLDLGWPIRWMAIGLWGLISLLMLASVTVWIVRRSPELPSPIIPAAFILAVWAYLAFGLPASFARQGRTHYRANVAEYIETEVRLSEERIDCKSEVLEMSLGWSMVKLVVDAPGGLMFCTARHNFIVWLPSRLLGDPGARDGVLRLVEIHGIPIRRLG